jgi:hypothetical protein
MSGIKLLLLYLAGCVVVTFLIDRWDMSCRPGPGDKMTRAGMFASMGVVLVAWLWIGGLLWLGAEFFEWLVKL